MTPDPDVEARRTLRRHRAFATALLVLMAALTLGSYALPASTATDLLQAAAKAGFVGGIADWFAVTALFRHPLGIPIPHTAIIPNQKERLGAALGRFVATHVFTGDEVAGVLSRLDLPGILHRFLADPVSARPAASRARRACCRASSPPWRTAAPAASSPASCRASWAAPAPAGWWRARCTAWSRAAATRRCSASSSASSAPCSPARRRRCAPPIEERVREQGGRLVGWALGASIARRVLATVNAELDKMSPDGSELRAAFDEWVRREIARLEEDPARAAELGAAIRRVVAHETVQAWLWDVWARLRLALEADAARPNGRTVATIEGALANLGAMLEADPAARERVHAAAQAVVASLLPTAQVRLAEFIGQVVANWDAGTIVERLELSVGKDLQYVRVNGTLVGFLVGGLLYWVLRATFGHVSF